MTMDNPYGKPETRFPLKPTFQATNDEPETDDDEEDDIDDVIGETVKPDEDDD